MEANPTVLGLLAKAAASSTVTSQLTDTSDCYIEAAPVLFDLSDGDASGDSSTGEGKGEDEDMFMTSYTQEEEEN